MYLPETDVMQEVLRERLALAAGRAAELERRNALLQEQNTALREELARLTGRLPAPPRLPR